MTLLVLHHQQTAPQQKPVTGLLSELAPVRVMDSKRLTVMSERLTKWKKAVFLIYFLLVVYYLRCKCEVAMERFLSERRA